MSGLETPKTASFSFGSRALLILLAGMWADGVQAHATCAALQFRWEEDCSVLRGRSLDGLDQLRYLPLTASGSAWLTLGGEYRLKIESLDAPNFDVQSADQPFTAFGQRWLAHADLRTASGVRAFLQVSAASDTGRKPTERPFDRSNPDIAQAFVDLPLPAFDSTVLRVGRQELDSGGNRLISTRDAANLRLAFDMAHLETHISDWSVVCFYGRPVINRIGAFDDRGRPAERFYGGWVNRALSGNASSLHIFFFVRDRTTADYEQGIALDKRRTAGARYAGNESSWDYSVQGAYQYGEFGFAGIGAYGIAGDVGWHPAVWGQPRAALSFGVASGDQRPKDRTQGTFDVLYPNLGYFTDAPVYYPGNTADCQPNLAVKVANRLSIRGGTDFIFRMSKSDAVYAPPGIPLVRGDGAGAAFVAALSFLRADWAANAHVQVSISAVHGFTGSLLQNAGGRDFNYGALTIDLKE